MPTEKTSEFRLTVTLAELGERSVAEDNMEQFLDAFASKHPEVGAVAASNYHQDTMDLTFSVDAVGAKEALDAGVDVFLECAEATSVIPSEIVDMNVSKVGASELHEEPELTFA